MVLVLSTVGIYLSPVYGGGILIAFDGEVDQDWHTPNNWDPNGLPPSADNILIGDPSEIFSFDVNIGDGISPAPIVVIGDGITGSVEILDQNSLTIKEFSTVNTIEIGTNIFVRSGSTLTIDGILNTGVTSGDVVFIIIESGGLVVISSTGVWNHFGEIIGSGTIEVCPGGTFNDQGIVDPLINQTVCVGAPVGSISIPIDSTPMLVAGNQMNSIWITLAIAAAVGIAILIIRRN